MQVLLSQIQPNILVNNRGERKKLRKPKTQKQSKENIIRDIKTLLEQEDNYFKLIRVDDFRKIIISNMNVTVIEILIINRILRQN